MSEKGRIFVNKIKGKYKAKIKLDTGREIKIPTSYSIDMSFDKKSCEIERKNGDIVKLVVGGKEIHKKQEKHKHGREKPKNKKQSVDTKSFIENTKLPKDTRNILKSLKKADIQNYNLLLNKTAQFKDDKFFFFDLKPNYSEKEIEKFANRYKNTIERLNIKLKSIILKPNWRLIVGLGNESVYETSITLHHIYGFPYIPGSAIKGVTRHWRLNTFFETLKIPNFDEILCLNRFLETANLKDNEKNDLSIEYENFKNKFKVKKSKNEWIEPSEELMKQLKLYEPDCIIFQRIFGTQNQIGKVIFFDSYPKTPPIIKIDIMNPHYEKYPPADYYNPIPIPFLTIENTEFEFMTGIKEKDDIFESEFILNTAEEYLKQALLEHGIGAKTSVGYGYMGI